ncbi:DUF1223 domain-containing protein [Ideonella sp. DXS29W]|uniref:DUF1223 domain-containing protein n=1 Tax=Ideonella lacteola TaxID=2984193 RepID=A0ABU9BSJ5_9BURK
MGQESMAAWMCRQKLVWWVASLAAGIAAPRALAQDVAGCAGTPASTPIATPTAIVELYTSEGCSSCPPADLWLSAVPRDGAVLALAFHVDYWDSPGWADRFADASHSARQRQLQASDGARFVYTPQILVNGRDFPSWRQSTPTELQRAIGPRSSGPVPAVAVRREGPQWVAEITPAPGASERQYAGYWALLEDGHRSRVTAGENAGRALQHDHVVRRYRPVGVWPAQQAQQWRWPAPPEAEVGHAGRAVFVVTDASGGRPLTAGGRAWTTAAGCPPAETRTRPGVAASKSERYSLR